jgi:hypothetical protein
MSKEWAIVVPYRKREEHLSAFIPHYKYLFPDVDIYIIEQSDLNGFNRGKLLNVGGVLLKDKYSYIALHDVDMLVVKSTADYSFPNNPTHLATRCSQFQYKMPYAEYFGGVLLIKTDDFIKSNGFSNEFYHWGIEDDDFRQQLLNKGFNLDSRICKYECFNHERPMDWNIYNSNLAKWKKGRDEKDGISNCEFKIASKREFNGYTKISVLI